MTGSVMRRHDVLVQHDVEARMRDGVVLRVNFYRPAGEGRYPVLLSRQPYNKDITSSSHPRWIRHTNTYGDPIDATELRVARQQILHDPARPSRLHLTVL